MGRLCVGWGWGVVMLGGGAVMSVRWVLVQGAGVRTGGLSVLRGKVVVCAGGGLRFEEGGRGGGGVSFPLYSPFPVVRGRVQLHQQGH